MKKCESGNFCSLKGSLPTAAGRSERKARGAVRREGRRTTLEMLVINYGGIMLASLLLIGCAAKTDVPHIVEPSGGEAVSVAYLKSHYERSPVAIDRDIYIRGRVVSSDSHGNFYKTLVVEDSTAGLVVRIDLENYYRKYPLGSLVRINCNSLVLSDYGGTLQLVAYAYDAGSQRLGHIPAGRLDAVISVDMSQIREVVPPVIRIDALTPNHISRTVRLTRVQFVDEELGAAWTHDGVDTDRHITDLNGGRLIVRTSAYATFAQWLLPHGSGSIQGVVGYFNGKYQLAVCGPEGVDMKDERF